MTFNINPWHRETDVPVKRRSGFARPSWSNLQNEVNNLFDDFFGATGEISSLWNDKHGTLSVDLIETKDGYKVAAELPGMEADDVEVAFNENTLTIKGKKEESKEDKDEDYVRRERFYGTYERSFSLPDIANAEKAKATFKKGVLTIEIPKNKEAMKKTRKIEIKEAA